MSRAEGAEQCVVSGQLGWPMVDSQVDGSPTFSPAAALHLQLAPLAMPGRVTGSWAAEGRLLGPARCRLQAARAGRGVQTACEAPTSCSASRRAEQETNVVRLGESQHRRCSMARTYLPALSRPQCQQLTPLKLPPRLRSEGVTAAPASKGRTAWT